jgi:transposase
MKSTDDPSDLTDAQFARIAPLLPAAKPGGTPGTTSGAPSLVRRCSP